MATQLAPTPVVKGKMAAAIYKEMQQKPTEASKRGAQILMQEFAKKVKQRCLKNLQKGIYRCQIPFLAPKDSKVFERLKKDLDHNAGHKHVVEPLFKKWERNQLRLYFDSSIA